MPLFPQHQQHPHPPPPLGPGALCVLRRSVPASLWGYREGPSVTMRSSRTPLGGTGCLLFGHLNLRSNLIVPMGPQLKAQAAGTGMGMGFHLTVAAARCPGSLAYSPPSPEQKSCAAFWLGRLHEVQGSMGQAQCRGAWVRPSAGAPDHELSPGRAVWRTECVCVGGSRMGGTKSPLQPLSTSSAQGPARQPGYPPDQAGAGVQARHVCARCTFATPPSPNRTSHNLEPPSRASLWGGRGGKEIGVPRALRGLPPCPGLTASPSWCLLFEGGGEKACGW